MTTTKPIDRVRLGSVNAAIWRNHSDKGHAHYNVTIERGYKDAKGDWQSTTSFSRDDLLTLSKAAEIAYLRIHELQADDRERATQSAAATQGAGR